MRKALIYRGNDNFCVWLFLAVRTVAIEVVRVRSRLAEPAWWLL